MKLKSLLVATVLLASLSGTAWAQEVPQEEPLPRPRTGIGFQGTWPAYGLSGIIDLGDRLSAQAVLGFGYGLGLTGRGLYRFSPQELFTPYGFGAVGFWSGYFGRGTVNFGAGVGGEADLRRFAPDLPPLFVNLEVGLGFVPVISPGLGGIFFMAGPGIHYRF